MNKVQRAPVRHITQLSRLDKRKFIDSFDLVLLDCDGVIWLLVGEIPHTSDAINMLKDAGKKCKFVSNNSVRSEPEYLEKFQKIGLNDVKAEDIVHPARSMTRYVKAHYQQNARFFSVCSFTANDYFRQNGLQFEELNVTEPLRANNLAEKIHLRGQHVDAVLFDINLNLNYAQLARAALYLKQGDCDLIVGASDAYLPLTSDMTVIGFRTFMELLALQHQRPTIVLGKPGAALGGILKELFNIEDPKRVLFVGDSLQQDVPFGKQCGFQTLLVLTGTASKEDLLQAAGDNRPDFYADSLADFTEFIKSLKVAN